LPELDRMLGEAGVTSYLVAATSSDPAQVATLARAADAREPGSGLLGLHLEGPVLAPTHRGAHAAEHLRTGDDPAARGLLDLPGVRLVTLAPEVDGAMALAREAIARGIVVAAGHTGASAEQARAAIDAGVRLATHLFNAMTPVHQREPGAAVAYLVHPEARVAFICDGAHLHDDTVELILRAAGERALIVSDAAPVTGEYAALHGGATLAGSTATIADGVRRLVRAQGLSLDDAVWLASARPASVLGDRSRGRLEPGARADLTIWNGDAEVVGCIRSGRWILEPGSLR